MLVRMKDSTVQDKKEIYEVREIEMIIQNVLTSHLNSVFQNHGNLSL